MQVCMRVGPHVLSGLLDGRPGSQSVGTHCSSADVGKRQHRALWATVMSDSLGSAGLWKGFVVTR